MECCKAVSMAAVYGFGLGEGTVAEGWFDNAVRFWEDNMVE